MRVLNPNYLWTCDPYTADHNYMLSKTFKMCDPVVDDRKLDALFCGIISASPPGSPLSQACEISGNDSQDIFSPCDVDLNYILDDCNLAAKALAEVQVTLQLEYNKPGINASCKDASGLSPLPINEQGPCLPTVEPFVEADLGAVKETTGNSACSGSPLLHSSALNLSMPVPIKQRVAPDPISTEQCMTVAQGSRPAVTSTATRNATLTTTPAPGLSLPVYSLSNIDILSSEPRAAAPVSLIQNCPSLEAANTPHSLESKERLSSNFVSINDGKNIQSGFTSSLYHDSTKNQTRAEPFQNPTVDPVPVIHSERLTSHTPVIAIPFLNENKGKRKQSSNEIIKPTEKKRRVKTKRTKASPAVDDAVQPSSSTVLSGDSQNLPAQRRKRARKSEKEKPEIIDVDQEPQPSHASSSTVIQQPNGMRQLLPASMHPSMPPTYTSPPSSVAQSAAFGSQPFTPTLYNNVRYGIPGENLGMPPGAFNQVSNYSAQYLERQRALLLRQQMQAQLQQARGLNQTVGPSFVDPRFAPNGAAMSSMLAPTTTNTTNNGIWNNNGRGGAGPSRAFFQNSSLQPQAMEPFDTFGVTWTPPVQAATTHPQDWYQC